MMGICKAYYESPIGPIEITGDDSVIYSLSFVESIPENCAVPDCLENCLNQLDEYFRGLRKCFSIHCILEGTPFEQKVWRALSGIPFGETISYAQLAERVGNKKAARAVGAANRKNKLPVIIPCHRVIGSNGSLTGYSGELWRKKWLLEHEARVKFTPPYTWREDARNISCKVY